MALTKITSDGITDGTVLNADINASAAIDGSKISPDFGSQNITCNRINDLNIGRGTNSLNYQTVLGGQALDANNSGIGINTAIGWKVLTDNTSGHSNVGVGAFALTENTSGHDNTGLGRNALGINVTGNDNTAV